MSAFSSAGSQINSRGNGNVNVNHNTGVINNETRVYASTEANGHILTVSPESSLNPKEAFLTLFQVENKGQKAATNLSYVCSVFSVRMSGDEPFPMSPAIGLADAYLMVPFVRHVPILAPSERTTVDCDFLLREASRVASASVELDLSYEAMKTKRRYEEHFKFSGLRSTNGDWVWLTGGKEDSLFSKTNGHSRRVLVIPFGGESRKFVGCPSASSMVETVIAWSDRLRAFGNTTFLSTMMTGRYQECGTESYVRETLQTINTALRARSKQLKFPLVDFAADPCLSVSVLCSENSKSTLDK